MNEQQAALVARVIQFHRQQAPRSEVPFLGVSVCVRKDVFNPFLAPSGPLMIQLASRSSLAGKRVLDIGCGSGVASAIFAAYGGAREVVAVDINPAAIECTKENAQRFGVRTLIDAREGDLYGPIRDDERFDIVVADLPFADAEPRDILERAFYDPGLKTIQRCVAHVDRVLTSEGTLVLAWSDLEPVPWPVTGTGIPVRRTISVRANGLDLSLTEFALNPRGPSPFPDLELALGEDSLQEAVGNILVGRVPAEIGSVMAR